jgi:cell division protein ZapA
MGSVEVNILGQKYIIKGDAPPEYIRQLAEIVDQKLKEVYSNVPNVTPLKAAILAALNIADEFQKLKAQYDNITQELKNIEDKTDSIIRLFD